MHDVNLPIACTLSAPEKREREATLIANLKSGVLASQEIEDGYAFRFSGEANWLVLAAELIAAERECCPFLRFELVAEPNLGAIIVRITGPQGSKKFLMDLLL